MMSENRRLKGTLQASDQNLSSFMSEMNQLLDQHELGQMIGQALLPSDQDLVQMGIQPDGNVPGGYINQSSGITQGNRGRMGETGGEVP